MRKASASRLEPETRVARYRPAAERAPRQRSRVTNGKSLFVSGDGNSAWTRRYRDLVRGHANDCGGEDLLSESEKSLIKRASAIECELEAMEGRLSRGETVDLDKFTRAASHLRRILETLGLERRQRDITPTLEQYAARSVETAGDEFVEDEASDLPADDETPTLTRPTRSSEAPS
jgi:hypothetical protein